MQTVLLDKEKHDRGRFDCGIEPLNNYLKVMANQQAKRDNARSFVLEDTENPSSIIGFYTLAMTLIDLKALPPSLQKKHHSSTSGGLIARLAVDQRYKGKGFSEWLLIDALRKLLQASDAVGFPLVLVDAKDGAKSFYQKYGFTAFLDAENKLFLTIAEIRITLT